MHSKELFSKVRPAPDKKARILLLTHDDLDGSGSAVILKSFYKKVDIIRCSNSNMDEKIRNAIETLPTVPDFIFITDISCTPETAEIVNNYSKDHAVVLLDHHKTAQWLNQYDWAVVTDKMPENSLRKLYYDKFPDYTPMTSATGLMWDYICDSKYPADKTTGINLFTHLVSTYDTFEWYNKLNLSSAKELNMLFYMDGFEIFENYFTQKVSAFDHLPFALSKESKEFDNLIGDANLKRIAHEYKKIHNRILEKQDMIEEFDMEISGVKYSCVFCFEGKYPADMLEFMKTKYTDKDLYILSTGNNISLRSVKPEIDVSAIAKSFGGGGHHAAAGFSVDKWTKLKFLQIAMGDAIISTSNYCTDPDIC